MLSSALAADPIKIGVLMPLTGRNAAIAKLIQRDRVLVIRERFETGADDVSQTLSRKSSGPQSLQPISRFIPHLILQRAEVRERRTEVSGQMTDENSCKMMRPRAFVIITFRYRQFFESFLGF
jgi:hypothetical protein